MNASKKKIEGLINAAHEIAYTEQQRTSMPIKQHIDLSTKVGIRLAQELGANKQIVKVGCLMMDSMLGQAMIENKLANHVQMSVSKTNTLLDQYDIPESDKENIRHCVLEHHGVSSFFSIESEICCNADCYRFVSLEGFIFTVQGLHNMPLTALLKLLEEKANEKWNALSIPRCLEELRPQYEQITGLIALAKSNL